MFRVGQKVVCIKQSDQFPGAWTGSADAKVGNIYTIRAVFPDESHPDHGYGVLLYEVKNPLIDGGEPGFYSSRFRPVVERATDISAFTEILNRSKVEA